MNPQKPTVRIETTTDDTGERREMLGYAARHVITTTKQTPLNGTSQPSLSVTDGWYIDLDRSISCDPKPTAGIKHGVLTTRIGVGSGRRPIEIPEFIDNGKRETGLPLDETTTHRGFPDDTSKTYDSQMKSEVVTLERTALDAAL